MRNDDALLNRIAELEELLGLSMEIRCVNVSQNPWKMFGLLVRRQLVTREFAFRAIYGGYPEDSQPKSLRIIDTLVHRLRVGLKPYGVTISTEHPTGYYLDGENRKRAAALVGIAAGDQVSDGRVAGRTGNSRVDLGKASRNTATVDRSHMGMEATGLASSRHR